MSDVQIRDGRYTYCDRCDQPILNKADVVHKNTFNFHKVCPAPDRPTTSIDEIEDLEKSKSCTCTLMGAGSNPNCPYHHPDEIDELLFELEGGYLGERKSHMTNGELRAEAHSLITALISKGKIMELQEIMDDDETDVTSNVDIAERINQLKAQLEEHQNGR